MHFADRLIEAVERKGNPCLVGLDPRLDLLPGQLVREAFRRHGEGLAGCAAALLSFGQAVIDAVADIVPAVKPQIAFYELFGPPGLQAYLDTVRYARQTGLLVIGDAKRGDIDTTAAAYAKAHLGQSEDSAIPSPDALTVNGYLGSDGVRPFIQAAGETGRGIFVLVKTSNRSSGELQDLRTGDRCIYEVMADLVREWGAAHVGRRGYSLVGAVVGATYPQVAAALRGRMPQTIFLVPGYGAQGGGARDVVPCFQDGMMGALVNSSRAIIYAYRSKEAAPGAEESFQDAVRDAARRMVSEITGVLQ